MLFGGFAVGNAVMPEGGNALFLRAAMVTGSLVLVVFRCGPGILRQLTQLGCAGCGQFEDRGAGSSRISALLTPSNRPGRKALATYLVASPWR